MIEHRDIPLTKVFDAAGGIPSLAAKLGISRHAIYQWDKIPIDRVNDVSRITGISRSKLRPDYYGKGKAA